MKKITLYLVGILFCKTLFAGDMNSGTPVRLVPFATIPVITFSLGPAFTNSAETQSIELQPDIINKYVPLHNTSNMLFGEVFIGGQRFLNPALIGQFGLAGVGVGSAHPKGYVLEHEDDNQNNYSWDYKIMHSHLALKGKLIGNMQHNPYISASMGLGYNYAYSFRALPHSPAYPDISAFNFLKHHSIGITWSVGLGIQKFLTPHWQLGVGYEFANWGKSRLRRAPGEAYDEGLYVERILVNQVLVSAVYLL